MKILALDTASETCSVAIYYDGEVHQRYEHQPQQQARLVLPMIEALFADHECTLAQMDAIAFTCGPGSFTGLRVAAAVTQGLALAANIPVIPISTLAVLAQGAFRRYEYRFIMAALDARMSEIYAGLYQVNAEGLACLQHEEIVCAPDQFKLPTEGWAGVGSAWRAYPAELEQSLGNLINQQHADMWPEAADLLTLAIPAFKAGAGVAPEQAQPVYLRNNVAQVMRKKS